jgi:hypothetical protein
MAVSAGQEGAAKLNLGVPSPSGDVFLDNWILDSGHALNGRALWP